MSLPVKQLVFNDFSPGIVSQTRNVGLQVLSQPGPAQESGTYRCVALPTGALAPLPRVTSSLTVPSPAASPRGNLFVITGLLTIPQVFSSTPYTTPFDEVHVGVEWGDSGAGNPTRFSWYAIRSHDVNTVQLATDSSTAVAGAGRTHPFFLAKTRLRSASAKANVSVAGSWLSEDGGKHLYFWPNPANPSSTTPLNSTTKAGPIVAHDGSVVMFEFQSTTHGSGVSISNEFVHFTSPPLTTTLGAQEMLFSPSNPTGYGAWLSTARDELFLVKPSGGAVVVSGELSTPNPPVGLIPFVPSTGPLLQQCVPSPIGIIYCTVDRVILWDGQVPQTISPQLKDGFFLRTDPSATVLAPRLYNSLYLQYSAWDDWVVFPNNYLLDTLGKGWWRLEDPTVTSYQIFTPSSTGVIGTTGSYAPSATSQLSFFSKSTPAVSYSWRSHPISVTADHYVDVREVEVIALAAAGTTSTVIITLTDSTGTLRTETFTLTQSDQPMRIRKPTYAKGYNVNLRIESASNQANVAAPTIFSVSLGYHDSHTTAST